MKRVLIVEDQADIRELIRMTLEMEDLEIHEATTGAQGLEAAQRLQPQLVLLQKTLLNVEGLGRDLDPDLDLWATAKPFLEQWMLKQVGPQRLWAELQAQAPRYAKILPDLPLLLQSYLQRGKSDPAAHRLLEQMVSEQKRIYRLIQALVFVLVGFALGALGMQLLWRLHL